MKDRSGDALVTKRLETPVWAAGRNYKSLAIQEGSTASLEYPQVTFGDASEDERQRVRRQLEEYCGQDTEGMIWIVDRLRGHCARE